MSLQCLSGSRRRNSDLLFDRAALADFRENDRTRRSAGGFPDGARVGVRVVRGIAWRIAVRVVRGIA